MKNESQTELTKKWKHPSLAHLCNAFGFIFFSAFLYLASSQYSTYPPLTIAQWSHSFFSVLNVGEVQKDDYIKPATNPSVKTTLESELNVQDLLREKILDPSFGSKSKLCKIQFGSLFNARIVISLTSTESRIHLVPQVIAHFNQIDSDVLILVNLYPSFLFSNLPSSLLTDFPNVVITELILDFGPLSRAVGAYLCIRNDPVVVLIDDDNLYHFEKLKILASFVEWNDTQAYGLNGLQFNEKFTKILRWVTPTDFPGQKISSYFPNLLLEAYSGVAFRKSKGLFPEILSVAWSPRQCWLGDDFFLTYLWQSKYFQVRVPQKLWAVAGELEVNSHVAQTDVSGATNLQNYQECFELLQNNGSVF